MECAFRETVEVFSRDTGGNESCKSPIGAPPTDSLAPQKDCGTAKIEITRNINAQKHLPALRTNITENRSRADLKEDPFVLFDFSLINKRGSAV